MVAAVLMMAGAWPAFVGMGRGGEVGKQPMRRAFDSAGGSLRMAERAIQNYALSRLVAAIVCCFYLKMNGHTNAGNDGSVCLCVFVWLVVHS